MWVMAATPITGIVLVHGAWHGAWCWTRVLEPLRAEGFRADAVDLPGHGDSAEPLGDLHADADAVRSHLDASDGPVLLVGHSYGGMVITDAGEHDAVAALVYICASMPTAGQTQVEATALWDDPPEGQPAGGITPAVGLTGDGTALLLENDGAAGVLYNDCEPGVRGEAINRVGHQSLSSFMQPPRHLAWTSKPSTYVICTEDRVHPPWHQRQVAVNADRVVEIPAGHSPFLSQPGKLARIIADAARVGA
jgi:pimeloyl-ACP methyl ester carboxylesterase